MGLEQEEAITLGPCAYTCHATPSTRMPEFPCITFSSRGTWQGRLGEQGMGKDGVRFLPRLEAETIGHSGTTLSSVVGEMDFSAVSVTQCWCKD